MAQTAKKVRIAAITGLALLAGCQDPDVGQSCSVSLDLTAATTPGHFIETGNPGAEEPCENLICILSPDPAGRAKPNPYCSKPCVSDDECFPDATGLKCIKIAPDDSLLASLPETMRQKYLADVALSSFYCALPDAR